MPTAVVDLRSDTVTQPSAQMRTAMAQADVGDDVFGEDPTVRRLEEHVAGLLGHQAGLFCVSGSLANWLAINQLVPIGQELLCDAQAHVVRAELGAHGVLGSVTTRTWPTQATPLAAAGQVDPATILALVAPSGNPYLVGTAAVSVENTHNFAGGTVQPLTSMQELHQALAARGVALHIDGARLWHACVATGVAPAAYGSCATAMSVCLSKGLGAPMGSVLVGPAELIAQARVWRKRVGAGWRQAGLMAAAGLYAVHHHLNELHNDHERAATLAAAVSQVCPDALVQQPQTNIVLLEVPDAAGVVARLAEHQVLAFALDTTTVRLITHRDVSADQIHQACEALKYTLTTH